MGEELCALIESRAAMNGMRLVVAQATSCAARCGMRAGRGAGPAARSAGGAGCGARCSLRCISRPFTSRPLCGRRNNSPLEPRNASSISIPAVLVPVPVPAFPLYDIPYQSAR